MTSDLIARIEAAQPGETRGMLEEAAFEIASGNWSMNQVLRFNRFIDAEAYHDAAMTLVPEGWRSYSADMSIEGRTRFVLEGPKTKWLVDDYGDKCAGDDWYSQGVASTPALAVAAASLKAKDASSD